MFGLAADQIKLIHRLFRGLESVRGSRGALLLLKPGVVVVDVFDTVLDPLNSELNFTIGILTCARMKQMSSTSHSLIHA